MAPLLKVKKLSDKVILPSRGSALAVGSDFTAGYDLSSIKVGPGAEALHRRGCRGDRRQLSGPVGIALFNLSEADFAVRPGDRVVQMIVHVIATPEVTEVKVEYVPEKPNLGADDPLLLGVFEKLNFMSLIFFLVVETAR
ncbi:deoxyuridine 5 -triphosphate nucleotidohydrolase [Hordeum vulgare]|nr:deoxyuridine 5 -triphosphate nucleotidohydrolase [Hordeum vulgare]